MTIRSLRALLLCTLAFAATALPAAPAAGQAADEPTIAEVEHEEAESLDAIGHTMDGNYLDFSPFGIVELPRLFLFRDAAGSLGLEFYGSTEDALRSGHYVMTGGHDEGEAHAEADLNGEAATADGDAHGAAEFGAGEPPADELTITQEVLDQHEYLHAGLARTSGAILIDFSFTRHLIFALLAALVVCLLFIPMAGKYKRGVGRTEAPRGTKQNMLETLILYIRDEIARPALGEKSDRYLPYLLTVFFFILCANLFGLVPFGASITANLSITALLAVFTFVITQFSGSKDYWTHIFNPPGIPWFVKPILIPIEIMGLFIKPFALAIRLFANMLAGHLVILNLVGLIFAMGGIFGAAAGWGTSVLSVPLALFISLLELLVAFIQAYVFTILSALFIGMATAEHEQHAEGHHAPSVAEQMSAPLLHGNGQPVEDRQVGTEAVMA